MPTNLLSGKPSSSPAALVPLPHPGHLLPSGLPLAFSLRLPPWMEHSGWQTSGAACPGAFQTHRLLWGSRLKTLASCVFFLLFTSLLFFLLISRLFSQFVEPPPMCYPTFPWGSPSLTPLSLLLEHVPWLGHVPALQGANLRLT